MNENAAHTKPEFTPEEIDEAAVWIAQLHAPDRPASVERGFRRWLSEKPSHTAAFETVSHAWELTGALKRRPFPKLSRWERAGFRTGFIRATAAVAAVFALVVAGAFLHVHTSGIATAVGEQRVLTLDDGTRISLNTASRVVVKYDERERRVELKAGEALFEVAPRPDWPFIVKVGERQVRALGTSFVVRRDDSSLAVTLIEGQVAVSGEGSRAPETADNGSRNTAEKVAPVILAPGQRLVLKAMSTPQVDTPRIETITAWRRGQVDLEHVTLLEAVEELNRYTTLKLVVANPEAADIHINGVFRAGDAQGFAAAIAQSYGVQVERRSNDLILTVPTPQANQR